MSENTSKHKRMTYADYKKIQGYAPTGCLLLDLVVGGGEGLGFPYGKMINIVGDKSSGKTFLSWEVIAANFYKYKKKLKYNYDGAEDGDTFNTKKLYGVDLQDNDQNWDVKSELVETFDGNTSLFLDTIKSVNQYGIYCIDSLDALSDKDKEAQDKLLKEAARTGKAKEGKGSYNVGTASHLSKQYFRTKTSKIVKKKVLLLIVSQVREVLGAGLFDKKIYRTGGKGMDFYAHTCLWLYTITKIKKQYKKAQGDKKFYKPVGAVVKCVTEKSKTPRPYRECYLSLYFDYGFDDIGSCVDYLFELRTDAGKLVAAAIKNIPWSEKTVPRTFTNMKTWLQETEQYETFRDAAKEDTGKKTLKMDWCEEFIERDPELVKKATEYFGEGVDRDTLIGMIENDPKLYEELATRVVDRWEKEEEAVLSNRRRKYL